MAPSQHTVTQLLAELQGGNRAAANDLFRLVYDELQSIAHWQRRGRSGDNTVNTTALVHEVYLKLVDQTHAQYNSRAHFLAVAAKAARHILFDYAKARRREKRGGDIRKISLEQLQEMIGDVNVKTPEPADVLVVLDEALQRLEQNSERQSRIVECRFFGGMTVEETATALELSPATVKRGWEMARAWLYREMQRELEP